MRLVLHPAHLMGLTWVAVIAAYFLVPIDYVNAPGPAAWSVIVGGASIFSLGAFIGGRVDRKSGPDDESVCYDRIVSACTIIGLLGIMAMIADKVLLSEIDWSDGINAVRERRSSEIIEDIPVKRSWLLYLGYLTFSFSCVSTTLFILIGERLGRAAAYAGQFSVLPMIGYAVLYGGRMPILLVLLLCIGAAMTRKVGGNTLLPSGHGLWPKLIALFVAFAIYTNALWEVRREANDMADYSSFVSVLAERWRLQPSPWIQNAVEQGQLPADSVMNWLSVGVYLTHSLTIVQRMIEHWEELSTYWGLYQVAVFSPVADILLPSLKLPQAMRSELIRTGLYGWFPSAWGAWLGDAGAVFGPICVFVWGVLTGLAYRAVKYASHATSAQLMLPFWYMSVLISPLNGPFGLANSFLIFGSFVVVALFVSGVRRMGYAHSPRHE
jgi:hypothetical protein